MKENLRLWLIQKLGGYPDAESAIDAVEDRATRKKLLTLAVKRLFNTIGPEDILKVSGGVWFFQGKALTDSERSQLIAEATQFRAGRLWQILQQDIKWQANRKQFLLAKDEFDQIAGKLWQYTLDCIATRLNSMNKGLGEFNVEKRKG